MVDRYRRNGGYVFPRSPRRRRGPIGSIPRTRTAVFFIYALYAFAESRKNTARLMTPIMTAGFGDAGGPVSFLPFTWIGERPRP